MRRAKARATLLATTHVEDTRPGIALLDDDDVLSSSAEPSYGSEEEDRRQDGQQTRRHGIVEIPRDGSEYQAILRFTDVRLVAGEHVLVSGVQPTSYIGESVTCSNCRADDKNSPEDINREQGPLRFLTDMMRLKKGCQRHTSSSQGSPYANIKKRLRIQARGTARQTSTTCFW